MAENVGFGANKLIVSLPSCENAASVEWGINLASQFWPFNISVEYSSQEGEGQDLDILRNHTVAYALGTQTKYIWFLKETALPPNWAIHRMLEALRLDPTIMICAGMSETNVPESVEFEDETRVFVDDKKKEFELFQVKSNNYVELECTLVKTELFDYIEEPWFKSTELVSSASYLCHKVMKAGGKVCAHSGVIVGYVDKNGKSHWPSEALVSQTV